MPSTQLGLLLLAVFRFSADARQHGYWFPTIIQGVDTLDFSTGALRVRQIVKSDNYRKP